MTFTDPEIKEFELAGMWKSWFSFVLLVLLICLGFIINLIRFVVVDFNQYWWLLSLLLVLIGLFMVGYGMWYYLELITYRLTIENDRIVCRTFCYYREILFTEIRGYRLTFPMANGEGVMVRVKKLITIVPTQESGKVGIAINHHITNYSDLLGWISTNFTLLKA